MARYGLFVLKVPLNPNQPTCQHHFHHPYGNFNKIWNRDLLALVYQGCPRKWLLNECQVLCHYMQTENNKKNIGDYDVMHGYCIQLSSISTHTNTLTPEMPQSAQFLASYAHDHITNSVHIHTVGHCWMGGTKASVLLKTECTAGILVVVI